MKNIIVQSQDWIVEKLLGLLVNPEYHIMVTLRDNSASLHDLKPKQCKNE